MDTPALTYGELSTYEQDIVSQGRGWDGTHYHDHKSGTVIEALEEDGVAKYRVVVKGDTNVTGEVPAEVAPEPEAPAAPATEPTTETVPTDPATAPATDDTTVPTDVPTAPTDVTEPTTDTVPTAPETDGTVPAPTDDTAPQGDQTPE